MASVRPLFQFLSSEVSQLFKTARRIVRSPYFDILAHPRKQDFARLLALTPKRIGNAVKRNRIRRRLKSIFYEEQLFNAPYDYVIISKKPIVELSFGELKSLITTALTKK